MKWGATAVLRLERTGHSCSQTGKDRPQLFHSHRKTENCWDSTVFCHGWIITFCTLKFEILFFASFDFSFFLSFFWQSYVFSFSHLSVILSLFISFLLLLLDGLHNGVYLLFMQPMSWRVTETKNKKMYGLYFLPGRQRLKVHACPGSLEKAATVCRYPGFQCHLAPDDSPARNAGNWSEDLGEIATHWPWVIIARKWGRGHSWWCR